MLEQTITVKEVGNYGRNKLKDMPDPYYVPEINGNALHVIAETYDVAYLLGLQVKYIGYNSKFAMFACRMLGIKSVWCE